MDYTRVGLYIRVSTAEQANEGYSIGEQNDRLNKYADAHGWTVVKVYADPGLSGGNINRPGLEEMIAAVKAGSLDKVVVYKLDRLSRSQKDTMYLIEDVFLANGVDFVSMTENFDTGTPFGMAIVGILSVFAQLERAQIKERMNLGRSARAKEGKWHGGNSLPIGYDYDKENDLLVINDFEALQVRELAKKFLAGQSFGSIVSDFMSMGYYHRRGKWIPKTMRAVLKNKTYCGYIKYNDEWIKGKHTPIMTEDYYETIQKRLQIHESNYAVAKDISHKSLLGGLIFCGNCGARYYHRGAAGYKKYACYSKAGKAKPHMIKDPNCPSPIIKESELDAMIIGEIKKLKADPAYMDTIIDSNAEPTDIENQNATIKKEVAKIDDQISKLIDLYTLGSVPVDQLDGKIQKLTSQKENLLNSLEAEPERVDVLTKAEAQDIIKDAVEILETGDLKSKQSIIRSLIESITIYSAEDITIRWKFC